jgi:hypothetical protein
MDSILKIMSFFVFFATLETTSKIIRFERTEAMAFLTRLNTGHTEPPSAGGSLGGYQL